MAAGRATRLPGGRTLGRAALWMRRVAPAATTALAGSLAAAPVTPGDVRQRLAHARGVFEAVDLWVAPSASLGGEFVRLGLDARRLEISDYGFAETGRAVHRPRTLGHGSPWRVGPGTPVRVGFIGTLVWHKGAHLLLEAARLLAGGVEVHLHGDTAVFPDYVARLRQLAAGLPVTFHGRFDRAESARIYGGLDVLAVPSLWPENSPLVIHEAFLHGVAVVGTRMGGIANLISHDVNGLLAGTSAASLAAMLSRLADEPGLRGRLAGAAPRVKTIREDAAEWDGRYARARSAAGASRVMIRRRIPVVIPTFNAGPGFEAVLDGIAHHEGNVEPEIIALDSGSTDGTVDRLRRRGARVVAVPPGRFNHGETRNEGLAAATGDFAVLLVQDAVPVGNQWIDALLAPLLDDRRVAGSFARQLPARGASRLTVHQLSNWIGARDTPRIVGPLTPGQLAAMTPAERHDACAFDNVCSCVRLDVWRAHPFRRTTIAEDLEWGRDVLRAGFRIAYAPAAVVRHSHERTVGYELQRTYLVHQRLHALFGLATVPTVGALLRSVGVTVVRHLRLAASEPAGRPGAILRGLGLGVAWPLGQHLGARSARDGRVWLRTGRI